MAAFRTAQGRTYNLSFFGLREVGIGIGGKVGDVELGFEGRTVLARVVTDTIGTAHFGWWTVMNTGGLGPIAF